MLKILAQVYLQVTNFRNYLFDSGWLKTYRASLPVVSVGNLTVGGNAKTPTVIHLAKELEKQGFSPVVLSRGYGGKLVGPHIVNNYDQVKDVGDEPLLMFKQYQLKVVVAKNRVAGAKLIENQQLGNVIILDDGFQHRYLERDFDLVLINASTQSDLEAFKAATCLPAGRFREDKFAGLKRASAVMLVTRQLLPQVELIKQFQHLLPANLKQFTAQYQSNGVINPKSGAVLSKQKVLAICAIANPSAFFSSLESLGYQITHRVNRADHAFFSMVDIQLLRSKYPGVPLVMTEKDLVKLPEIEEDVFVLPVGLQVREALLELIMRFLRK